MRDANLRDPCGLKETPIDLEKKVEVLTRELSEALERQTAMTDVLGVCMANS
jgi:hypothetical protein